MTAYFGCVRNSTTDAVYFNTCDSNETDFLGNTLRRGTPSDCCHTDSNASTTAAMQQQNTPITQVSFGEDDSSCDSHTRWGKLDISMNERKENVGFEPIISDWPPRKKFLCFLFVLCDFLVVKRWEGYGRGVIS